MDSRLSRDCQKLREYLPEYAEGRLAGRARARVERHLGTCARCAHEVAYLRSMIGTVRAIPAESAPDDLVARVCQAIDEQAPAPAAPVFTWVRLAVPAAVLTGVVAVALVLKTPVTRDLPSSAKAPSESVGAIQPAAKLEGAAPADHARTMPPETPSREGEPETRADQLAVTPPAAPAEPGRRKGEIPQTRHQPFWWRPGPPPSGDLQHERAGRGRAREEADDAREYDGREEELGPSEAAEKSAAPLSAHVAVASAETGKMIALKVTAQGPLDEVILALGDGAPQAFSWQGWAGEPAWIPLSIETIGPGPAAIRIRLEAREEKRHYVLFVPVLARLGEAAESAPTARYQEAPLRNVLADLSAFTGLVILAEPPLDIEFSGSLPSGKPGAALQELGAQLGFASHREGHLAYTLTHAR